MDGCRAPEIPEALHSTAATIEIDVRMLIDEFGRVTTATMLKSHPLIPDDVILRCARAQVFKPAHLPDGTAVPYPFRRRFVFKPQGSEPAPKVQPQGSRTRKTTMHFNLIELWAGMNNLVRMVVVVLTIQALACMAVTVDRIILLIGAYRRGRKFARKAGPVLAARRPAGRADAGPRGQGQPPGRLHPHRASRPTSAAVRRGLDRPKAAELAARALERKSENLSRVPATRG